MVDSMPALIFLSGLAARVDAVLPQTQCTRCGYPDCAHYAQAVAAQQAGVDQCPPGGAEGVQRIAAVVQRPVLPLNPEHGVETSRTLAVIDENWCIGCTLCLDACPTDAILGASKRMHTVVASFCTGCELCLPVCPVDCIGLVQAGDCNATGWGNWSADQADMARTRYVQHLARKEQSAAAAAVVAVHPATVCAAPVAGEPGAAIADTEKTAAPPSNAKMQAIALAMLRARAKNPVVY